MTVKEHIASMQRMADLLMRYTVPKITQQEEIETLPMKHRFFAVDGYELGLTYSKGDFDAYISYKLQIQSVNTPFLPFALVCKVGKLFLGDKNLYFADFLKNNKKVYCWLKYMHKDNPLILTQNITPAEYEGFKYNILNPGSLNLYEG